VSDHYRIIRVSYEKRNFSLYDTFWRFFDHSGINKKKIEEINAI